MTDEKDPPEPIANHRWRRVRLTDLPGRIVVGTPERVGDEFQIGLEIEGSEAPEGGGEVVPFPKRGRETPP